MFKKILITFFLLFVILFLLAIYMSRNCGESHPITAANLTRRDFTAIQGHLDTYKMSGRRGYPTQEQGLKALVHRPTQEPLPEDWVQSLPELPRDSWGNLYIYRMPGSKDPKWPEIISKGRDGKLGTEDDMSSQDGQ